MHIHKVRNLALGDTFWCPHCPNLAPLRWELQFPEFAVSLARVVDLTVTASRAHSVYAVQQFWLITLEAAFIISWNGPDMGRLLLLNAVNGHIFSLVIFIAACKLTV